MKYCDLHTHSNYSDGTYTPTELINEAESMELSAIALCDHNTVSGLPEFLSAAKNKRVDAVAGIELSTDYGKTELHILGLFIDPSQFFKVEEYVKALIQNKENSNRQLIERLKASGYNVDFDEIKAKTPNGRFNRAHIGEALTEKGYVSSISEAFSTLLSRDSKYYVPVKRVDAFESISFLKSIGAVTALAHPFLDLNEEELRGFLPEAKRRGLDAMESLYMNFDDSQSEKLCEIADEFSFLYSGGSDFHGARKPDILLGHGKGYRTVPTEVFEKLKALSKKQSRKNE